MAAKATFPNRTAQTWGVSTRFMAVLMAASLALMATSALAAVTSESDVRAAESRLRRAEDAAKQAERGLAKQQAALDKANAAVNKAAAEVAKLQGSLTAAKPEQKDKLAAEVRKAQEAHKKTLDERSKVEADLARATAERNALLRNRDAAATEAVSLKERRAKELAEWQDREAQAKAAAAQAKAAPAAAAVPAAVVQTTAPAADANLAEAQARKVQADAVVRQRTDDLAKSKDAAARKDAESALRSAEQYAAKQERELQKAQPAPQPAAEPLTPKQHQRQELVSEPAPWTIPAPVDPGAVMRPGVELVTPPATAAVVETTAPAQLEFDVAMVSGDKEITESLDVWKEWAAYITFNKVTPADIGEFHGKLVKALQEKGYVFAKVTFPTRIWNYGIFLAKVDCGPLGTITVSGNRHYSAQQIIRTLSDQDGARFNYSRVHGDLFDLNARPDLSIDAKLKPVMQDGRRVINADLEVEDSLPLHGSIELSNTGTDDTNDWRIRTTLQHVNLTKHDDVLSVDWLTSPDVGDVNAWSGTYFLPVDDVYSVNVYGGYSKSDIDDVIPQLDVRGRGYFFGAQITKLLTETPTYRTQLSAAWLYQYWEQEQDIMGANWDDRRLRLSMPSLTYGYSGRVFDNLGGRNFASATVMANFAGNFGSSTKEEFIGQGGRGVADGDFTLLRFQVARLQRFFAGEDVPGKWTLFMKADGQFAGDALPAAVRRSVGGANSVRGYEEGELSGDNAVVATLELRTPLFRNFIPGLKKTDDYLEANPQAWQQHRLQFVMFTDLGWLKNKEPLAGEMESETLASIGAGLRLGLTKYSQMRLDYAYALEDTTDDTPSSGRFHLSMQLQF